MNDYQKLKDKWRKLVENEETGYCFDWNKLTPGKFCVHISDEGGTMPCVSYIETTGFFDSKKDALAFYRFAEIPRILNWDSRVGKEKFPDEAEFYLSKYETNKRKQIEHLLRQIGDALKSEEISAEVLSSIRELYNEIFKNTNPANQILALGNLVELLTAPYFSTAFDEDIAEECDEKEKPSTSLKELLDSGSFGENNSSHLSLAKNFLERHMIA